jgi:hypothetical protein
MLLTADEPTEALMAFLSKRAGVLARGIFEVRNSYLSLYLTLYLCFHLPFSLIISLAPSLTTCLSPFLPPCPHAFMPPFLATVLASHLIPSHLYSYLLPTHVPVSLPVFLPYSPTHLLTLIFVTYDFAFLLALSDTHFICRSYHSLIKFTSLSQINFFFTT